MKKNLAFVLALVMLLGSLLCVAPVAEGEDGSTSESTDKYVPAISYANVNYTDSIYMMFAVEAPAALAEGESVELLVWDSRDDSLSFSYLDTMKTVLTPEAEPITIGEQSYLVFKYADMDATEMTNVICARPVLVKDGAVVTYGKLVEYSIREYVESAKGNIDGIAGIEDEDTIKALDTMLAFGSLAQQFSDEEYAFLADDAVNSIYATINMNGIDKGKVFAGFFKYKEGGEFTFDAPFFDGTTVAKIVGADGNIIKDLDEYTEGVQIEAVDSDITLAVYYENVTIRAFSADAIGPDMEVNNHDEGVVGGLSQMVTKSSVTAISFKDMGTANLSGSACEKDSANRMNYWHSVKTVADPDDPDGLVFMLTATNKPALSFNNITPSDFSGVGFGDTIYPAFTFEITLGAVNGRMPTVSSFYFRYRQTTGVDTAKWVDLYIFKIVKGELQLTDGTVVGTIPETGMRKFAITVDALTNKTYGYAENAEGVMENTTTTDLTIPDTFTKRQEAHLANLADEDPSNDTTLEAYESIYTFFTKASKLEPTWVFGSGGNTNKAFEDSSIEINGVDTPIKNADGYFNMEAVKALAERDYSFLLDDYKFTMGAIYE